MEDLCVLAVGVLLLVFGFLIGIRQQIHLVHSYHYKRVAEQDKPAFCKGVGIGNALVGVGLLISSPVKALVAESAAVWVMGAFVAAGLAVALLTIIKYNKGLF